MSFASSSVIRRHFRQRFGISASRVGIRREVKWYWYALLWIVVISVSLAIAGWMYDAGRRFAGFERAETEKELQGLRDRISALEVTAESATEASRIAEGRLQVELATLEQLTTEVRSLKNENSALKEDLALFDGLVSEAGQTQPGIRVPRATLEVGETGKVKYRILILHQPAKKRARDFSGSLQFYLTLQQEGRNATITIPPEDGVVPEMFNFSVKHLYRAEGVFELPAGSEVLGAELRLLQDGVVKFRQMISR